MPANITATTMLLSAAALALVLGLIWLAQRAARAGLLPRHLAPAAEAGRLALVSVQALDPRRRLLLVRCDGRHVLLLTGGPQDLVVGWMEEQA
jgi:flagellar protein FliO/FliZ